VSSKLKGSIKMKIKCFRFECSQCGEVASIQVFYRKDGIVGYARARHKNNQGFFYHPIPKEYAAQKLRELNQLNESIDHGQVSANKFIDPNNLESSSKLTVAGGEGFEPSTPNLGGWCSIRAYGLLPSTPHL
jgi:hypothetical protein